MKLDRVTLENFRQYHGKQRLSFARDHERNVTIIHGINGAGKTSLFLALNWCLYGRKANDVKVVENVGELFSKEAISQAAPGNDIVTSVELTFLHEGIRYMARRATHGIKQADNSVKMNDEEDFILMQTGPDGRAERVRNPDSVINAILPANVRTYFLFDGEKINEFAKPEAADEVKDAIYLVLNLELLKRAEFHLESLARDYRRELKSMASGELSVLLEANEKARTERDKVKARIHECVEEIKSAKLKIKDIDDLLREQKSAQQLQKRREDLNRQLEIQRGELSKLVENIQGLATTASSVLAHQAVIEALALLDEKRKKGEIPSNIRQQFVADLIDQAMCICGRPIDDNSPEHQRLLDLLGKSVSSKLENEVLETNAALRILHERADTQNAAIQTAMKNRVAVIDVIDNLEAELSDVQLKLKGSPESEVSRLESKRQSYQGDIDSLNMEIGGSSERIEKLDGEIDKLEQDIKKAQKAEKKESLLTKKMNLAQSSTDAISEMKEMFADEMRKRIEEKTKDIFRTLVWKQSHFEDVRLGPDFKLEVIDRYGMSARPELSAGERQVLSLSFITAMSRVSGEEAPLVMDTPFGRLSSHHRSSITKNLPILADQLVLFVTDEELRDEALENLKPHIGAEYELNFNLSSSTTTIDELR